MGILKRSEANNNIDDNKVMNSPFQNIKKGFLDASYVISFKDNLSTDAKTLAKSVSSQLASKNNEFARDLMNLSKTSNIYNIDINAPQQQIDAQNVYGGNYTININGSPSSLSVFNDLVRIPLESFLKKNPQKNMVFIIDGLDESITTTKDNKETDYIISILSNLDGLRNVYFIITTRDYENILNKFKNNSLIFDISLKSYIRYINEDVYSFIKLNLDKNNIKNFQKEQDNEKVITDLIEKVEGNFLYIKFVMDAVNENKIEFSLEEIDNMPSGLFGMYRSFL